MNVIWVALALGLVSMTIVFFAGLTSGVVRTGTLIMRTFFAFCMTSAATYFLMMLYDLYEELHLKKLQKLAEEIDNTQTDATVTNSETNSETPQPNPPVNEGFQPMNANNLPNAGR